MKRVCDTCGKECKPHKLTPVENKYGRPRWFCPKCYKVKLREIEELWNLHLGFRSMEGDD